MKIVLVHDWLTGMRGGEKCLEVICQRFPDAPLFTLLHRVGRMSPAIERMRIRKSFLQWLPGVGRHYRRLLPLMPRAIESLELPTNVDLVLSFSHAVAKSVRVPPGIPHVCYCFTPMRYAWHLREDYLRPGAGDSTWPQPWNWARNQLLDRLRDWDRSTSHRVTQFVAISQTVSARIRECYGRESTVIAPPVDTDFFTPAAVPRDDFYLCFSALVPYKRVDLAIEACRQLGRRLVIVGAGPEQGRLERLGGYNAQFTGWLPDEALRDQLRRCRALLFPAHEDFGIAPLEAQACGTPVIAFAKGGATETLLPADQARKGTAVFFGEQSADSLVAAMQWFEAHEDRLSSERARANAERYHRSRYERELMELLNRVATSSAQPDRTARRAA